jgi:hypothetical protein
MVKRATMSESKDPFVTSPMLDITVMSITILND